MIVIGGGDTGADCVASAHRDGAASVTQVELLGEPPEHRPDDVTPWPLWPMKLRTSYALKEGGSRSFAISTTGLSGNGRVQEIQWMRNSGAPPFEPVPGSEEAQPAGLVLLAMGFTGPEPALLDALGVATDARGNVDAAATRRRCRACSPPATRGAASRSSCGRSRRAASARPPSTTGYACPETACGTYGSSSRAISSASSESPSAAIASSR